MNRRKKCELEEFCAIAEVCYEDSWNRGDRFLRLGQCPDGCPPVSLGTYSRGREAGFSERAARKVCLSRSSGSRPTVFPQFKFHAGQRARASSTARFASAGISWRCAVAVPAQGKREQVQMVGQKTFSKRQLHNLCRTFARRGSQRQFDSDLVRSVTDVTKGESSFAGKSHAGCRRSGDKCGQVSNRIRKARGSRRRGV